MRQPYGGHHYTFNGQTFRGNNYDEVVAALSAFRINNNIPLGEPDREVLEYYQAQWPWLVEEGDPEEKPMLMDSYLAWRLWLIHAWANPPKKLVVNREASERMDICKNCPMNQPIPKNVTTRDESIALKRKSFLLRRGSTVPEYIGYCALHRADLGVFCFLENFLAFSSKRPDAKDLPKCWARSLVAEK